MARDRARRLAWAGFNNRERTRKGPGTPGPFKTQRSGDDQRLADSYMRIAIGSMNSPTLTTASSTMSAA
jgi:hypothetical protein